MNWLREQAASRHANGLHRSLRGRAPSRVDIASNDYLGLSRDPEVIAAGIEAMQLWGAGATGSRLVSGHTELHEALESALATLLRTPTALAFSSGYLANLAAVTALTDSQTLLLSDAHNHASIIDACRLSRAHVQVYPNRDLMAVREALANNPYQRAVVVTDAVFSVDGTLAPLADLAEITAQHDALLIVDEAHSLGVLGPGGAGACVATGANHAVRTVTLSKSIGSQGGAVAADAEIIDHLINSARSFIFDTGLAPAATGSALAATQRILSDPELPARALVATDRLVQIAQSVGWQVFEHEAAVASIRVGAPADAVLAQQACADAGVDVGCFRPPSVPDGIARLRMTGHANLTDADFHDVEKALAMARETVGR